MREPHGVCCKSNSEGGEFALENRKVLVRQKCLNIAQMVEDCLSWKLILLLYSVVNMKNGINSMKCMRELRGGTQAPGSPLWCL